MIVNNFDDVSLAPSSQAPRKTGALPNISRQGGRGEGRRPPSSRSLAARSQNPVLTWVFCLVAICGALSHPSRGCAQALPAATKPVDFSVYGGYVNGRPDYAGYRNTGESFGVMASRSFHLPFTPSLEGRVNLTNGPAVQERTYLPGVRATGDLLHVLHPYAAVLLGYGTIHFNFPNGGYTGDNSIVYSLGGGLNVDVGHNVQLMGDFQYQHWNFGGSDTLTPTLYLFGATYHIPFRPLNAQFR